MKLIDFSKPLGLIKNGFHSGLRGTFIGNHPTTGKKIVGFDDGTVCQCDDYGNGGGSHPYPLVYNMPTVYRNTLVLYQWPSMDTPRMSLMHDKASAERAFGTYILTMKEVEIEAP